MGARGEAREGNVELVGDRTEGYPPGLVTGLITLKEAGLCDNSRA